MAESITDTSKGGFKKSIPFSGPEMKEAYGKVQKTAVDAFHNTEDFIREYPVRIVLGAVAIGFLAGYIAKKSS